MNAAAIATLILAVAALATALGLTRKSRGDRHRVRAETDSLHATAAAQYALASTTMLEPLTQQLQQLRTRLNSTETDMAQVRGQLRAAIEQADRTEAARADDRRLAEDTYRIAANEISQLRTRLDTEATECHEQIRSIRAQQQAELDQMRDLLGRQ